MKEKEVYEKLASQAPQGYRINELIRFNYPVRKVKIKALVNKLPDESLIKVYNALLRSIDKGFNEKTSLFDFLGIPQNDEFILRELFSLRAKGMLDLVSETWYLTEDGKRFIEDNKVFRVEEREEYEFLIDGITGKVFPKLSLVVKETKEKEEKFLERGVVVPIKSPELLKGKYQQVVEAYKQDSQNTAYLISYDEEDILFDRESWIEYWFVEYISNKEDKEPYLEVRNIDSLEKNYFLTSKFNNEYWKYVVKFTDSDRKETDVVEEVDKLEKIVDEPKIETRAPITELTIWETKQKFIESLQNVKEQILIESPWIKKATREYIPYFRELLNTNKKLIILYGINEDSEHDYKTLNEIKDLQNKYSNNFTLVELSDHLKGSRFTGSHRKLLIKDNDYYISGSFNFLSFAKKEGDRIANEESQLITIDVNKKWERVIKEYSLSIQPPTGVVRINDSKEKDQINVDKNIDNKIVDNHPDNKIEQFITTDGRALSFKTNDNLKNNSTGVNRITKK